MNDLIDFQKKKQINFHSNNIFKMCHKTHEIDVFFYEKVLFKTIWDVSHNSSIRQKLKCVIHFSVINASKIIDQNDFGNAPKKRLKFGQNGKFFQILSESPQPKVFHYEICPKIICNFRQNWKMVISFFHQYQNIPFISQQHHHEVGPTLMLSELFRETIYDIIKLFIFVEIKNLIYHVNEFDLLRIRSIR